MTANPPQWQKPVVGLIGAIGAGKSTVAQCLARRGGSVVDADRLGHEVLQEPEIRPILVARWGPEILNDQGGLDRSKIAAIVFRDPNEREFLQGLMFPRIHAREDEAFRAADQNPNVRFHVLDAAVLLEAGKQDRCQKLLYVDAPREVRIARVHARQQWDEAELTRREHAQWSLERKQALANASIWNDSTPEVLQARVDHVLREWGWLEQALPTPTNQQKDEGS